MDTATSSELRPQSPKPPAWPEWKVRNGSKRWYLRYPLAAEWTLEWFVHRLRSLALFDLLELAGRCTVLVVAIFWVLEANDRAKERHFRAWDLINSARGSTGDGGRRDALQDLNKDGISLTAAPLEEAFLSGVDLQGAHLGTANLERAILQGANLQGAHLKDAFLAHAHLEDANLEGANLRTHLHFLTQEQLDAVLGDDRTQLPDGLTRPAHWSKAKAAEDQPAPR